MLTTSAPLSTRFNFRFCVLNIRHFAPQAHLGRQGLLWAFTVIVFVNATIYFYGDQRIPRYFNGRLLEGFDPWGVTWSSD